MNLWKIDLSFIAQAIKQKVYLVLLVKTCCAFYLQNYFWKQFKLKVHNAGWTKKCSVYT